MEDNVPRYFWRDAHMYCAYPDFHERLRSLLEIRDSELSQVNRQVSDAILNQIQNGEGRASDGNHAKMAYERECQIYLKFDTLFKKLHEELGVPVLKECISIVKRRNLARYRGPGLYGDERTVEMIYDEERKTYRVSLNAKYVSSDINDTLRYIDAIYCERVGWEEEIVSCKESIEV